MECSLPVYLLLVTVAFVAGFVSSIAGSGGLIVLPALLAVGMPPLTALAPHKFQSVFGTLSSTLNFLRGKHLDLRSLRGTLRCALIGSLLSTWRIQRVNNEILQQLLPYALLALAAYVLFLPDLKAVNASAAPTSRWSMRRFAVWGGGIGFYGGFLGPALGRFLPLRWWRCVVWICRRRPRPASL